jgi:nicotinamidase-related amidase
MSQALLVIDVQESFRHRPYFRPEGLAPFLHNLEGLIDQSRTRDVPIVQVLHQELPDDPANPFARASGWVQPMPELSLNPAVLIYKQVHSALFGISTDGVRLEEWLRRRHIDELLISGIRTEQCCETTTRHASDLGFKVRYVMDATLTFPMRTRAGREVSVQEICERTELVLEGRFARVLNCATAFED